MTELSFTVNRNFNWINGIPKSNWISTSLDLNERRISMANKMAVFNCLIIIIVLRSVADHFAYNLGLIRWLL